ncbi:MAG: SxtJ family membrane protein [Methylophilaceae bacterium]|nr:SxtJ family membrane protein [Methylophilaceae bacterium]
MLPSNKKFGLFFFTIFLLVGIYCYFLGAINASIVLLLLATILFVLAAVKPDLLLPLNKLWMRLGLTLGLIISPIILGIIFFGLFTPIAILMRLFSRDELRLKLESRSSFWRIRNTLNQISDSFKNQF